MKTLLLLTLALSALPAHAQIYKWTDANGKVHYSDQPQDGKALPVASAQAAPEPSKDNWRERERVSRENRVRQAMAERRTAAAEAAARTHREPFNPSANRSDAPMTDSELCTRDRQQIEYAEKTKSLTISHGNGAPRRLTEAQRQEVISERKSNHALTCGDGRRR